jgi:hypothetical protein
MTTEETKTEEKPKMAGPIQPEHAKTLAKLSILFNDLSTQMRIADTYEDVRKAVEETDKAMAELSKDFDALEEVLKP